MAHSPLLQHLEHLRPIAEVDLDAPQPEAPAPAPVDLDLDLDLEASRELREGYWQIIFRQLVDGVRVEEARLDLHVVRGKLVMLGAANWGTPSISGVRS